MGKRSKARKKIRHHARRPQMASRPAVSTTAVVTRLLGHEGVWLLVVALCATAFLVSTHAPEAQPRQLGKEQAGMLFVGDVMLARRVDTLMDMHGSMYPFQGVRDVLPNYEVVIGNFEASVPERHIHSPDLTFRFSVEATVLPTLARVGFTDMTLANNHTFDFGAAAYEHTRSALQDAGFGVAGHPRTVRTDDILYRTIDDVRVAVVPINVTYGAPAHDEIATALAEASAASDLQVVSVHWGDEYELSANVQQRALAHFMIDEGAEAIIGHHPHVVQNIEEYRGAPIFYSLGNFVFDQYWNSEVQQGLMVALSFANDEVHYELIPISSEATRSVPVVMDRADRAQFLEALAARSEPALAAGIRSARIIELYAPLASL